MTQQPVYVGIDVSKATLDVAVRPTSQRWSVANREKGIDHLVGRLQVLSPALIVLEATGGLELPMVASLGAAGLPVVVVNPRQARDFAKATGKLAKTDVLDAEALALFAVRPTPRPLPDAEAQALSALLARRRQLIVMLTAERNRLSRALPSIRPGVQEHIAWLEEKLRGLDAEARPRPAAEFALARAGEPAAQCPWGWLRPHSHPAGRAAGVGHSGPQAHRGLGRSGAAQPGQRCSAWKADRLGWSCSRARGVVHGNLGRHSL